jgi:hypothetical protein
MNVFSANRNQTARLGSPERGIDAQASNKPTTSQGNFMYVPPFDSLLKAIGITRAEIENSSVVAVPAELLKLLLQVAVASGDFNEAGYLRDNPDIAGAVDAGKVEDARLHYVGFGYFEGRNGATPEVDEAWYLRTYADVADGIKAGQTTSAAAHFRVVGASEGRSPNAHYVAAAEQWKQALKATRVTDRIKR